MIMRTKGFTLVELLVAVGLSMVIILLVASAFRLVGSTISLAMRLSAENNLLRAGFIAVLDDADYWNSHGNPDLPYDKGFLSQGVESGAPLRKRHMAPVRFHESHDPAVPDRPAALSAAAIADHPLPNPNTLLPHDPRSFHRGHILPMERPLSQYSNYSGGGTNPSNRVSYQWYAGDSLNDPDSPLPTGWSPRVVYGPYHQVAATNLDRVLDPLGSWGIDPGVHRLDTIDPRQHRAAPLLLHRTFQRIGLLGVLAYLPRGFGMGVFDSGGRLPNAFSDPLGGFASHPYQATADVRLNWGANVLRKQLGDFQAIYGLDFSQGANAIVVKSVARAENSATSAVGMTLESYDDLMTGLNGATSTNSGELRMPLIAVVAKTGSGINRQGTVINHGGYISETIRLPWNRTDFVRLADTNAYDLTDKPKDLPILATSLIRLQELAGSDLTVLRSAIENPQTGKRLEVRFSTLSTTMRGARQHWSAISGGTMGDIYVRVP